MGPFRTFVFFAAAALLLSPLHANADTCPFQEQDGQVVIEIEAEPPNGGWSSKTSVSGYKGSSYYEWEGANSFGQAGMGTLTYKVKINNPGNYQFMMRSRIMIGEDGKEHNDSWVRMSGKPISGQETIGTNKWVKAFMAYRRWSWQTRTNDHNSKPIRQYFSAGTHTIEISGRSKGHAIDRIMLFQYDAKPYLDGADKPHTPTGTQESNMTNQKSSSCNGGGGTTTTTKPTTTTTKPTTTTTKPTTTTTKPTTTTTKPTTTTTKPTTTTTKPTTTTTKPTTTTTKPTTTTTSTTTTTTLPVSTTSTTMAPAIPGDVNGDGDVTVSDALETLVAAVGGGECALCVCDYTGDGQVTVADGFAILYIAVGREVESNLPPCL